MAASTPHPRGRPRDPASREAILRAAFGLLCERGYANLALEAVAAQAGVGKTTIYRWWPDRATLAVEAFFHVARAELAFPDTASAREDFRQQIQQLARLLRSQAGAALAAMFAGARTDEALRKALLDKWVLPRKRWGHERMVRARQAGETPAGIDVEAALAALYSPLYARLFVGLGAPSEPEVEAYLAVVFQGIFPPSGGKAPPRRPPGRARPNIRAK